MGRKGPTTGRSQSFCMENTLGDIGPVGTPRNFDDRIVTKWQSRFLSPRADNGGVLYLQDRMGVPAVRILPFEDKRIVCIRYRMSIAVVGRRANRHAAMDMCVETIPIRLSWIDDRHCLDWILLLGGVPSLKSVDVRRGLCFLRHYSRIAFAMNLVF